MSLTLKVTSQKRMVVMAFLFSFYGNLCAQDSTANNGELSYSQFIRYQQILDLQHMSAPISLLPVSSSDPVDWWLEGYAVFTDLIFKEQQVYYPTVIQLLDSYYEKLKNNTIQDHSWITYIKAENRLQSAIMHLRYGSFWSAAWDFRKAYRYSEKSLSARPDFSGNLKIYGTLLSIVGLVPSNFQWITGLAGMKGDFEKGLQLLSSIPPNDVFYKEALLLRKVLSEQSNNKVVKLSEEEHERITLMESNKIARLILIRQAMQQHEDTIAIQLIEEFKPDDYNALPLLYYLRAELYLRAGYYGNARPNYQSYLNACPDCDLSKDATYKAALCAGLAGNTIRYIQELNNVKTTGKSLASADKYAAQASGKVLSSNELDMLTIRFSLDGGYTERAELIIPNIDTAEQIIALELIYRKAKLKELKGLQDSAIYYYEQVAFKSPTKRYYFGPNSCLELMRYAKNNSDQKVLNIWYKRLKKFKNYPYKESINDKADDLYKSSSSMR